MAPGRRPFKILYLQSTSEVGGTDISLLRILQSLDKTKFEPHVILPKEGPFAESYRRAGARLHILPGMLKMTRRKGVFHFLKFAVGYLPTVLAIRKLIQKERIDLVHTNTMHNLYGFLAAKLGGVPHVWHIREIVVQSRFFALLEKFLVKKFSDRFIAMDLPIAETFLTRRFGFPPNLVKLYEGIDLEKFHPHISGSRIRGELKIAEGIPLVGMVCRLDPWKGVELFLEAVRKIHAERPEVRFLVCGGEIEGHEGYELFLKKKAAELGLSEAVYFTGWRYLPEDIPEVYRALNLSVQCSTNPEPYGLVCLEAMASAVPMVAPKEGGPSELCVDGQTALLVPPRNAEAVAQAVLTLLSNPTQAVAMGQAGRLRAERLFELGHCTREMEKIYEEIFKTHER